MQAVASRDVSCGGIQLMAAEPPEVGASVSCTLAAGSGCLTVPGRVRWCGDSEREPLRPFGVEFGPLSQSEQREVYELICGVERAESSPNVQTGAELPGNGGAAKPSAAAVELRLESAHAPLRALAYKAEQGLRLELALPWFNPGAVLRLAPLDGDNAREGLEGRVVNCRVREEEGAHGIGLELLVVPCEPARRRRYAIYEAPTDDAHSEQSERSVTPEPVQLTAAEQMAELIVPKTRVYGVVLGTLLGASMGVLLFALVRPDTHRPRITSSASAATDPQPSPRRTLGPALVLPPAAPPVEPEAPAPAEPEIAAAPPPPTAAGATLAVAPAASEPKEPSAGSTAPTPAAAAPAATEEAAEVTAPRVSVAGDVTEVFLPVEGSADDLRIALWTDPLAVAVDLPRGRIALTQARYDMKAGGVSGVSIGKNHGMTQVRVLLHALVTRYSALPAPGGVVIRLKLDLRPLP